MPKRNGCPVALDSEFGNSGFFRHSSFVIRICAPAGAPLAEMGGADSQADTTAPTRYSSRRMSPPSPRTLALVFVLLLAGAAVFVVTRKRAASPAPAAAEQSSLVRREVLDQLTALEARESELNTTVWSGETQAEECGRVFESLWDSLNSTTNKFDVLAAVEVGELVAPRFNPPQSLAHGIELREPAGAGPAWSQRQWRQFLDGSKRAGWELARTEFRHNLFDADASGQARQSRFYFSAHLTNPIRGERAILEGDLIVDWASGNSRPGPTAIRRIDASHLTARTRAGETPFRPLMIEKVAPPEKSYFIDPLIVRDLDGDGLSEIILAASNRVYRRRAAGQYEPEPLCRYPPGLIFTGIMADFDGDGAADFLCAKFEGLYLFKGSEKGTFDEPGRLVWRANPHLKYAQVLSCGDVDHDGDLDVFLGQYKVPYTRGQMPTPYYDANDGFPAYLLLNDGHGNFVDATAAAGLEKKRWRRTYSASMADLNDDGHLDLAVVSDFAGVDLYRNDGRGHFTDVTGEWIAEPHAFGMAHALADFNRLYLARPDGRFEQSALNDSLARSGWSWGCSAFDFDNDGFPDVYIANGHETKQSVREYEPEFWLHDLYAGSSRDNLVASAYFMGKYGRTRDQGWSYGGYEKNRLYLNQQGKSFVEAGHLLGVALEEDCRNVVTDDLDGDGRMDLVVTTFEAWPEVKQTLRVFQNALSDAGNWIGFRFREEGSGKSPVGVRVTLRFPDHSVVGQIVAGDSYRSQHADTIHFGLGQTERVDTVEIRWNDGQKMTLHEPTVNRYHNIRALPERTVQR